MFSSDGVDMPDALAGLAASAAIAVSDVPFHGPISEVRVARVDGEFVINPTFEQVERADIELMVGATYDNIMMVEGEMNEVSEAELLEALKAAHEAIKAQCLVQMELAKEVGAVKREYCHEVNDEELRKDVRDKCYDKAYAVAKAGCADKQWRNESFKKIEEEYLETIPEEEREEKAPMVARYYHDVEKEAMRRCVLDEGVRLDGRKLDEIRPIWCEPDYLPGPHGSAVFTRGETQALATCTLGTKLDEKILDDVLVQGKERFLLHYNFPPFSTGEAKAATRCGTSRNRTWQLGASRFEADVPRQFPLILAASFPTSLNRTVRRRWQPCAGTMALLDAGVKMKKPVAGIAMGLISDSESPKYAVLSDILGDEDHLGDMDFKVTGTVDGITATQMDIKCDGLSYEILAKALDQARQGRLHILNIINQAIPAPREDYKPHVPRIETMVIPKELIGAVIGPGGKVIQGIQEASGAIIAIDEEGDQGIVEVAAPGRDSIQKALDMINAIVAQPEEGEVYTGKVVSIMEFGAFVEFMPNRDGLLHISEIGWERFETMEDTGLHEGDEVTVKLVEIDKKTGKYRLSMRALQPKPEGYVEPVRPARPPRRDGDNNQGPRRDGDRRGGGRGPKGGRGNRNN